MTLLRIGTRGSDLALVQTRSVCSLIQAAHPDVQFQEIIIRTHGDKATHQPFDIHWPAGGFTGAIEQALLHGEIDLAVHSYKDLPTAGTSGLTVAAVPPRELPHDVLVCDGEVDLSALPSAYRIGTSSPRRAAQFRYFCHGVVTVALRGNVPTRLAKLEEGALDAVVLAAAGLRRLHIAPEHTIDLPVTRFVPAPAQGALAVQVREGSEAQTFVKVIDHAESRLAVDAERAFLSAIGAGCHTPAAALATIVNGRICLAAQLFSDDGLFMVNGGQEGVDPGVLGKQLADDLKVKLKDQ
jgi:hydroxymethylbilane synthase